jgi:hypothetical protein
VPERRGTTTDPRGEGHGAAPRPVTSFPVWGQRKHRGQTGRPADARPRGEPGSQVPHSSGRRLREDAPTHSDALFGSQRSVGMRATR